MIYFLKREDGLVKIGYTRSYYDRYTQLKNEHGNLELLGWIGGDMSIEKGLHTKFKHVRMEKEWFQLADDLKNYIETETTHEPPDKKYSEPRNDTFNEWFEEKIAEAVKVERERNLSLSTQVEQDKIEIIKLRAQVELLIELNARLQDGAIEAAFKFVQEHQLKIVS